MKGEKDIGMKGSELFSQFPGGPHAFFFPVPVKGDDHIHIGIVPDRILEPGIHDKDDFRPHRRPAKDLQEWGNGHHVPEIEHINKHNGLVAQVCIHISFFHMVPYSCFTGLYLLFSG